MLLASSAQQNGTTQAELKNRAMEALKQAETCGLDMAYSVTNRFGVDKCEEIQISDLADGQSCEDFYSRQTLFTLCQTAETGTGHGAHGGGSGGHCRRGANFTCFVPGISNLASAKKAGIRVAGESSEGCEDCLEIGPWLVPPGYAAYPDGPDGQPAVYPEGVCPAGCNPAGANPLGTNPLARGTKELKAKTPWQPRMAKRKESDGAWDFCWCAESARIEMFIGTATCSASGDAAALAVDHAVFESCALGSCCECPIHPGVYLKWESSFADPPLMWFGDAACTDGAGEDPFVSNFQFATDGSCSGAEDLVKCKETGLKDISFKIEMLPAGTAAASSAAATTQVCATSGTYPEGGCAKIEMFIGTGASTCDPTALGINHAAGDDFTACPLGGCCECPLHPDFYVKWATSFANLPSLHPGDPTCADASELPGMYPNPALTFATDGSCSGADDAVTCGTDNVDKDLYMKISAA
jgi:hypothetical protein